MGHPVEVTTGFEIPQGDEIEGHLGSHIEGSQGIEVVAHREADQLGQRLQGGLLRF